MTLPANFKKATQAALNAPVSLDAASTAWFYELKNTYLALEPLAAPTPAQTIASDTIKKIIAREPAEFTQQDIFDLEDWLIVLRPDPSLKQWVNSLRDEYADVFGADEYQKIFPSLVSQVSTASNVDLQAEARRLQEELHWQSAIQPWAQRKRLSLMVQVLSTVGIVLGFLLTVWILGHFCPFIAKLKFVSVLFLMGALGAGISAIQRIQAADLATSRAIANTRYNEISLGVAIAPLQGAIFAMILTILLLTGVAGPGAVVPHMTLQRLEGPGELNPPAMTVAGTNDAPALQMDATNPVAATNLVESQTSPKEPKIKMEFFNFDLYFETGKDLAILLICAFLAGFIERLVPDMLSRLADQQKH